MQYDVSNHQPHDCLLNRLFRPRSKKISMLRVTGLCAGNSPVNSSHKRASNAENIPFDDVILRSQGNMGNVCSQYSQKHLCERKLKHLILISWQCVPRRWLDDNSTWAPIMAYAYVRHEAMLTRTHLKKTWWLHQMETFSTLLALCAGNSPVTHEFPAQWPVTQSFDVFFDLRVNKRLIKQ